MNRSIGIATDPSRSHRPDMGAICQLFLDDRSFSVADPGQLQGAFLSKKRTVVVGGAMDPDDAVGLPAVVDSSDPEPCSDQFHFQITDSEYIAALAALDPWCGIFTTGFQFKTESSFAPVQGRAPESLFLLGSSGSGCRIAVATAVRRTRLATGLQEEHQEEKWSERGKQWLAGRCDDRCALRVTWSWNQMLFLSIQLSKNPLESNNLCV